eukprot:1076055-Amphidinium_carterae.1
MFRFEEVRCINGLPPSIPLLWDRLEKILMAPRVRSLHDPPSPVVCFSEVDGVVNTVHFTLTPQAKTSQTENAPANLPQTSTEVALKAFGPAHQSTPEHFLLSRSALGATITMAGPKTVTDGGLVLPLIALVSIAHTSARYFLLFLGLIRESHLSHHTWAQPWQGVQPQATQLDPYSRL